VNGDNDEEELQVKIDRMGMHKGDPLNEGPRWVLFSRPCGPRRELGRALERASAAHSRAMGSPSREPACALWADANDAVVLCASSGAS
jgi:hypothetical protein